MTRRRAIRAVDALGLVTIAAYGSWFYGFGILVGDMSRDLAVGVGSLGILFGVTTLVGGSIAIAIGRTLDRHGPRRILVLFGPLSAVLYGAVSFVESAETFCLLYVTAGGLVSGTGFYSFTQPLVIKIRPDDPMRAVTRLTIWGALASPVAIPLTEFLRRSVGWRATMRFSGLVLLATFLIAATVTRGLVAAGHRRHSSLHEIVRDTATSHFLQMYAASLFLSSMSISSLLVFQVPTMKWAGLSAATAASFAGARGFLQLLGRLPLLPIVMRFGPWRVQRACRWAIVPGTIALWFSGSLVFATIYAVVIGASAGALSALDGMVNRDVLPIENFGTTVALLGFVATVGSALGPMVVGVVVQFSGSVAFAPGLVVFLATAAALVQRAAQLARLRS